MQGLALEARTFNTVITACSKTGRPNLALKVPPRLFAWSACVAGLKAACLRSLGKAARQTDRPALLAISP